MCIEKLAGVTHMVEQGGNSEGIDRFFQTITKLSTNVVLPNLKEFIIKLPYMISPLSWSLLSRLFRTWRDVQLDTYTPGMEDMTSCIAHARPLSKVHIYNLGDGYEDAMDNDTFLHL